MTGNLIHPGRVLEPVPETVAGTPSDMPVTIVNQVFFEKIPVFVLRCDVNSEARLKTVLDVLFESYCPNSCCHISFIKIFVYFLSSVSTFSLNLIDSDANLGQNIRIT